MINRIKDGLLRRRIRALQPWHYDIQLTERLSTGKVFSPDGTLPRVANSGIKLFSPHKIFKKHLRQIFPQGMSGKRFLDCACNAGAHCFTARELDVQYALGFDIRKHWVDQAQFVQQHRTVQPTDRIELIEGNLYDLPERKLEPFDFTVFSGIFYHLPEPVTGLKIAADVTSDVILVNTMGMLDSPNPRGMTVKSEGTREAHVGCLRPVLGAQQSRSHR
jgi:tRNA (mo5U34)-methyltransferase